MMLDYLTENNLLTHKDATIKNVINVKSVVFVGECDSQGNCIKQHIINIFDIVKWMYNKLIEEEK